MSILFIVIALILLIVMLALCLRPSSHFRRHWAKLKTDPRSYFSLPEMDLIFRSWIIMFMLMAGAAVVPAMAAKSGGKAYRLSHQPAPPEQFRQCPEAPSAPVADRIGHLYMQYEGRIVPVHTVAVEFCKFLYGTETYKGLSADQVLMGFYYLNEVWRLEPITMVSLSDSEKADRCLRLIQGASDGSLFTIVPDANGGKWTTDTAALNRVGRLLAQNRQLEAFHEVEDMRMTQLKFAPNGVLPSGRKMVFQSILGNQLLLHGYSLVLLLGAVVALAYSVVRFGKKRRLRQFSTLPIWGFMLVMWGTLSVYLLIAWLSSGYLPISSPSLMLEVAAWIAMLMGLVMGPFLYHHPLRGVLESAWLMVASVSVMMAVFISLAMHGIDQLPVAVSGSYILMMLSIAFACGWLFLELLWIVLRLIMSLNTVKKVYDQLLWLTAYPLAYSLILVVLFVCNNIWF